MLIRMFVCDQCDYTTRDISNFKRHCSRKTPCGCSQFTQKMGTEHPPQKNNGSSTIRCNGCYKHMDKRNLKRHLKSCKGVPTNVCEFCKQEFTNATNKYYHRKKCKRNPLVGPTYVCERTFGQTENIESLCARMEYDERTVGLYNRFNDLVDLVFFNRDCPENQLVRKTNKKDDFIEFRYNDHWKPEVSLVAIPKLIQRLAVLTATMLKGHHHLPKEGWMDKYGDRPLSELLCFKWIDDYVPSTRGQTGGVLKDLLYSNTKRGPLDEQTILNRHVLPAMTHTQAQWDAFMQDVRSDYNKQGVSVMTLAVFRKMKSDYLEDIQKRARHHGIEHFYKGRDGEPILCYVESLFSF